MERSCATCKFSILHNNYKQQVSYYECRYNPPETYYEYTQGDDLSRLGGIAITSHHFPRMQREDWCFQYQIKEVNNG